MKIEGCYHRVVASGSGGSRARPPAAEPVAVLALEPTVLAATQPFVEDGPTLAPGVRVGRYLVERLVGVGGMGVVVAARDPDLDRLVALKLMGSAHEAGPEGTSARLLREGQAMARISHPNVVAVYDVGVVDDQVFVAMELVVGKSLRAWLEGRAHTWREIVAVFTDAGRGLEAAHAAGLVHRDFKPDNVLVGDDGRVRVADFGLARDVTGTIGLELAGSRSEMSPSVSVTRTGAIAGTPRYMSPEQHAGSTADHRTDQYSFCVALWLALYGTHPFGGSDLAELVQRARTQAVVPPPGRSGVPAGLRQVLERGLRAEPSERFPDMHALLRALRLASGAPRRRAWLSAATLIGVSALVLATTRPWATAAKPAASQPAPLVVARAPSMRPAPTQHKITATGRAHHPEVSADGLQIAWIDSDGLHVGTSDGKTDLVVAAGAVERARWSPDGQGLLSYGCFGGDCGAFEVANNGTYRRKVDRSFGHFFCWLSDGTEVAYTAEAAKEIYIRDIETRSLRILNVPGDYEWLLDVESSQRTGRLLVAAMKGNQSILLSLDAQDGRAHEIYRGEPVVDAQWAYDGDAVYAVTSDSPTQVLRIGVDPVTGAATGETTRVLSGIDVASVAPHPDGSLVYTRRVDEPHVWALNHGGAPVQLSRGTDAQVSAAISPDGRLVAYVQDRDELWVVPYAGGESRQLDLPSKRLGQPTWSPDGREVAIRDGEGAMWVMPVAGGEARRVVSSSIGDNELAWAPASRVLVPHADNTNFDWTDPKTGARQPLLSALDGHRWVFHPAVSADERQVAMSESRPPLHPQLRAWLHDLHDGRDRMLEPSIIEGYPMRFSADGRWLYLGIFDSTTESIRPTILRFETRSLRSQPWDVLSVGNGNVVQDMDITANGQHIVYVAGIAQTDIWRASGF
jgi:serine/threonine protein kinase